ncbi:MAG: hypothetical protein R2705_23335 [Ilumatobacteraceae bacterium]
MGVTLAALTVALATARTGLLAWLRKVMTRLDQIAGVFLVLTGPTPSGTGGTPARIARPGS